jgi:acetyl-CoA carboxylase biotin carboxylase subunit
MQIRRLFIANRGEIAMRIIRTCRALGIETVIGSSAADCDSMPARSADRVICIGPAHSTGSYLNAEAIVHAARTCGADALHPGYGFLSERPRLAQLCAAEGIIFVGPTPQQLAALGDKLQARAAAERAAVPVVPGGEITCAAEAHALAARLGVPLLIKAAGGGGGRGIKLLSRPEDLDGLLELASAEAGAAFGDARVYLERFVAQARHIEVQILGDGAGNVVHLGERDCSVQRRYQKLIEETPAPGLGQSVRGALLEAAVRLAASLNYLGAGTVEFIYDVAREEFYFLEVNARLQVEHGVTEAVTGIDLIAEQLAIAAGGGLRLRQSQIVNRGCAIECRINAENPAADFRPSPGRVTRAQWPHGEGVRVDTHIGAGAQVPPFYDSLLGKLIVHGPDRHAALRRLDAALADTWIEGVANNVGFQRAVVGDAQFCMGGVTTDFVPRFLERQPSGTGADRRAHG